MCALKSNRHGLAQYLTTSATDGYVNEDALNILIAVGVLNSMKTIYTCADLKIRWSDLGVHHLNSVHAYRVSIGLMHYV